MRKSAFGQFSGIFRRFLRLLAAGGLQAGTWAERLRNARMWHAGGGEAQGSALRRIQTL
jgi:hypothetical protein